MDLNEKTALDLRIEELEAQLRAAKETREKAREDLRDSTPVIWQFTVTPSDRQYDEVYDDTCSLYMVKGFVLNEEEARDAGHHDHEVRGGGMVYIFNTATGRLVAPVGGGTIYIGGRIWDVEGLGETSSRRAIREISEFLVENPDGGDITDIVQGHRDRVEAERAAEKARRGY